MHPCRWPCAKRSVTPLSSRRSASSPGASSFDGASNADWGKIQVVRCGLNRAFLPRELTPVPDRPRLVNVGRLSEQKGQLLLIEAAGHLHAQGLDVRARHRRGRPVTRRARAAHRPARTRGRVWITGFLDNEGVRREMEAAACAGHA